MTNIEKKLEDVKALVKDLESVVVAYSGGVDSALLAKICCDVLGERAVAVTAVSETYPKFELEDAKKVAKEIGIKHRIIETKELSIKGFAKNPVNRCYYCKTELFSKLKEVAKEINFKNIADGSNIDDVGDFRPGLIAAKELGSRSPLKECGLTKTDVRAVSKLLGLSTWDKPAFACISSRIPYGQDITVDKLEMVIKAEGFLRDLGFSNLRVRHHDTIARIEVPSDEIKKLTNKSMRLKIVKEFKKIGFTYITIDLEGLRSGSMNEVLPTTATDDLKHNQKHSTELPATASNADATSGSVTSLTVFTDGGSRGNPGKAGIGVAIYDNRFESDASMTLLEEVAEYVGKTTNNVAEYKALIKALKTVVKYSPKEVAFKLDSELLVKQINGAYKVKSANMIPLYKEVKALLREIPKWKVVHIPREENSVADELANRGMDSAPT
ncbi:MAG: ATP-dependent sacrificial sulfur transferase LarE [Candidatus Anammoxibacter sp.]